MPNRAEVPPYEHWLHFFSRGREVVFGSGDTQPQSDESQKEKKGVSGLSPEQLSCLNAVEAEKHEIG